MQNKANWEEVSSLELRVSSSGPALQTSHSPETAFRRRQGLPCQTKPIHRPLSHEQRGYRAKQTQFLLEGKTRSLYPGRGCS